MAMPKKIAALLPQKATEILENGVRSRFNAYLEMTAHAQRAAPNGDGSYTYPDTTMMTDLTMFWALFNDVNAAFKSQKVPVEKALTADSILEGAFKGLLQKGEFWQSPLIGKDTYGPLQLLAPLASSDYSNVWRTLRNGFAHFNWRYVNLSAIDYWTAQGWDASAAPPAFKLQSRPAANYTAYVVDGRKWDPLHLWALKDLRVLVSPTTELRYFLHLFLNYLLNGENRGLFG